MNARLLLLLFLFLILGRLGAARLRNELRFLLEHPPNDQGEADQQNYQHDGSDVQSESVDKEEGNNTAS